VEVLMLSYRGEPLREFPLGAAPLEIGRAAGCDIVVHDPAVRDRHLLVAATGGAVVIHRLDGDRAAPRPLATGEEIALGRHHSLARLPEVRTRPGLSAVRTEPIDSGRRAAPALSLVIGRGADARRVPLDARPLTVGSGDRADVRVRDRTVSALHCRFEPGRDGLRVRDLGSRNGTYVGGVVVGLAHVDAGSPIRIGRTDLRLVARGRPRDARHEGVVAESAAMRGVLERIERLAPLRWPVLVTGESGVGKEVVARALHARGARRDGPFVAINAGGMPASLVESELFGHEKGAFTGAATPHRGVFEQADGGALFLDEIGELPLELQSRLLRVLETWEVRRVGAERSTPVSVRLICATHRDPKAMVAEGTFRQDLYYRIAQLAIHVAPLRERLEDVAPLARVFLDGCRDELGPKRLSEDALVRLCTYGWPGNARALRNAVRRAAARCPGPVVDGPDVTEVLDEMGAPRVLTRDAMQQVVDTHGGNLAAAARVLGIPRTTLRDRLKPPRRR